MTPGAREMLVDDKSIRKMETKTRINRPKQARTLKL
jgi:hypothetical protein